jgi:hypothetical protein
MEPQSEPQSEEPTPHEIRFIINCPQCGGSVEATVGHDPQQGQWVEYEGECSCSSPLNALWGQNTVLYARTMKANGETEPIYIPWDIAPEEPEDTHQQVPWDAYVVDETWNAYVAEVEAHRQTFNGVLDMMEEVLTKYPQRFEVAEDIFNQMLVLVTQSVAIGRHAVRDPKFNQHLLQVLMNERRRKVELQDAVSLSDFTDGETYRDEGDIGG